MQQYSEVVLTVRPKTWDAAEPRTGKSQLFTVSCKSVNL
jgi:hypothetical protein